MIDLCHLDEAGFAMTLPTNYSWYPVGKQLTIPYEANQGRRVNVMGGFFSHGPDSGRLEFATQVKLPQNTAKNPRTTAEERAQAHGVKAEDVGPLDAEFLLSFIWKLAGRPENGASLPEGWKRERPLVIVLDNSSVHTGERAKEEKTAFEAAEVHLFYLPSYTPELSAIEPVWQDVKHHELPQRSHDRWGGLLQSVVEALQRKGEKLLRAAHSHHSFSGTT